MMARRMFIGSVLAVVVGVVLSAGAGASMGSPLQCVDNFDTFSLDTTWEAGPGFAPDVLEATTDDGRNVLLIQSDKLESGWANRAIRTIDPIGLTEAVSQGFGVQVKTIFRSHVTAVGVCACNMDTGDYLFWRTWGSTFEWKRSGGSMSTIYNALSSSNYYQALLTIDSQGSTATLLDASGDTVLASDSRTDFKLSDLGNNLQLRIQQTVGSGVDSESFIDHISVSAVPEPSTAALLGLGGLWLLLRRRRR